MVNVTVSLQNTHEWAFWPCNEPRTYVATDRLHPPDGSGLGNETVRKVSYSLVVTFDLASIMITHDA
jgi:hypothetical protein